MKKINENTKVTLTLGQLKRLVKESWPKDIEYDDEEIDMVDEPKKSNKDGEQKSPTTDRAKEIRAKIKEIKKERDFWMQRDDEEYKRYQGFEDRAGWVTRAKANKIRDGFFERMDSFRSYINDCNKRLKALNKELKDLVKEGATGGPDLEVRKLIEKIFKDAEEWVDYVNGANECAYTDDLIDSIVANAKELEKVNATRL